MDVMVFSQKLQRLVKEHEQVKRENERLKIDLANSQASTKQLGDQISTLEAQVSALRVAGKQLVGKDKEEMEKRINIYLREIDKAITLLNG